MELELIAMAGLSSSCISSTLAAEGTSQATRSLILQFFNTASSAAAISGIEPQEGPVVDKPTPGFGDQIRDYDIGIDVAQRIINKRNSLGGFTDLTQLQGISHFGADKLNDLLYSFSKVVYEISAINFNCHDGLITNTVSTSRYFTWKTISHRRSV